MEITPVPLGPLLRRIANENESDAREHGIDMCVQTTRAAVVSNPVLLEASYAIWYATP
jgi:hypothetical protein